MKHLIASAALLLALIATPAFAQSRGQARAALNRTLPELRFTNVALGDAVDLLRDVSGANVHVNWTVLESLGVSRDTTVNLRLRSVSMRKALALMLNETGVGDELAFYIDDNVIEITSREIADSRMVTRMYPVGDLLVDIPDFVGPSFNLGDTGGGGEGRGTGGGGGGIFEERDDDDDDQPLTRNERAQALIDLITETIRPDIWAVNGGTARIAFFNDSLVITAPRSVHEAIGGPID